MSLEAYQYIENQSNNVTDRQYRVLSALAGFANKDGECFPSIQRIAERAGKHRRTVERILSELEAKGMVTIVRRRWDDSGKQRTSVYVLPVKPKSGAAVSPGGGSVHSGAAVLSKSGAAILPLEESVTYESVTKESLDGPIEVEGAQEICAPGIQGEFSEQPGKKEKTPEEKMSAFPVTQKFLHSINTKTKNDAKAKVCFWFELLRKYHPKAKTKGKLSPWNLDRLYTVFKYFDKPIHAKVVLEWTAQHWEEITGGEYEPPKSPSLKWIHEHLEDCVSYFNSTAPVELKK